jgi:hypothetical protein
MGNPKILLKDSLFYISNDILMKFLVCSIQKHFGSLANVLYLYATKSKNDLLMGLRIFEISNKEFF